MQYPHQAGEPSNRPSIPPGSPWGTHMPVDNQQSNTSGAHSFAQDTGIKLPSLPRLGGHNTHSQSAAQRHPHQPSFAQMVQAQQPVNAANSAGKASDARVKYSNVPTNPKGSSGPSAMSNAAKERPRDTGAQILGSVNAHMMPRVNTSYGMSSLNTVLPGMASDGAASKPPGSVPTRGQSPAKQTGSEGASQNAALLENLALQDRRSSADATGSIGLQRSQENERYGLKSLLDIMDMKNKEKQSVILGSDLSQSGLDLDNSGDRLSHTFASPWQETSKHPVIPDYKLPACYKIDTVVPQQQKLQNFDEGALFYIFYTMPRDAMQEAAAVELTNRSWRYHKELKMWLTKDPLSEPIQTNNQEESGVYIFFDPTNWKKIKREYILFYPDIA